MGTEDNIWLLVNQLFPLGSRRKGMKHQLQHHCGLPAHRGSKSSHGSAFPSSWTAGLPGSEAMGASSRLWKQLDSKSEANSHQHMKKARLCNRRCTPCALPKQLPKLSSSICTELIMLDLRCCKGRMFQIQALGTKSRFVPAPFQQLAFLIAGSKMQEL